jgi:chromosome segregation ATPase
MNITNDAGSLDSGKFLDYIKKNLSSDVAQLVATKDELAKRQGALSAVEDAIKTKADADKYAADKKAAADELLNKAAGKNAEADIKLVGVDAKSKELAETEASATKALDIREKQLSALATQLATKEASLAKLDETLTNGKAQLAADRTALDARVKAFQDKVAALNV